MFAVAFDLPVGDTDRHHPKGSPQACSDIRKILESYEFTGVQGSLHVCKSEDLARLFQAIQALKSLPCFPSSVRDIRAFRVEQWSDFTQIVKT